MHPIIANAVSLAAAGRAGEAMALLQRHLRTRPRDADVHHALARMMLVSDELPRAAFHFEQAAALAPSNPDFLVGHAVALGRQGKSDLAERVYRRAAGIASDHFDAHLGLSHALAAQGRFAEASGAARRAAELNPGNAHAWINLSVCLERLGRVGESADLLRGALANIPDHPALLTQLGAELNYVSGVEPAEVAAVHRALGAVLERTQGGSRSMPPPNPDPDRVLRVAYLSPDFRSHSVASFFEPLLCAHDRARVRVVCISNTTRVDDTTRRLAGLADEWIDGTGLPDDALAAGIRAAAPDILVDLAGHTSESRVRVMARRLAPVQVTMIGYPNTTGLAAIDARVVDSVTDPPGAEPFATERLVRLDPCFLCYQPPGDAPDPRPLAHGDAFVFASFNIISKISDDCLDAWCEIVRATPGSVLRLKSPCFAEAGPRDDWIARFEARGVARDRLDLRPNAPGFGEHLASYHGVGLSLDTFPYNGTTTTCESLFMGVPVVTFTGRSHAGRVSASLLASAGLPELATTTRDEYAALASALRNDRGRLDELRADLRGRLVRSPLCDASAYAARLEAAFRDLWRRRCAERG